MADLVLYAAQAAAWAGQMVVGTHTFKFALFTSSATVSPDINSLAGLGANQIANGNGYTTGGATLTATIGIDAGNNRAVLDVSNPSFTASGGNIGPFRYGVLYNDSHADDMPVYIMDFGADVTIVDGQPAWPVTIDPVGLFTIAQAA